MNSSLPCASAPAWTSSGWGKGAHDSRTPLDATTAPRLDFAGVVYAAPEITVAQSIKNEAKGAPSRLVLSERGFSFAGWPTLIAVLDDRVGDTPGTFQRVPTTYADGVFGQLTIHGMPN